MTVHEVDVVVLGMGPGGEDAAERLAVAGLSVAGVEARLVGGECPYWGCIPSKMVIRGAELLAEGRRINGMAGTADIAPDYTPVATRIRDEATDDWNDQAAVDRLTGKGGTFVRGAGRLVGRGSDRLQRIGGAAHGLALALEDLASLRLRKIGNDQKMREHLRHPDRLALCRKRPLRGRVGRKAQ